MRKTPERMTRRNIRIFLLWISLAVGLAASAILAGCGGGGGDGGGTGDNLPANEGRLVFRVRWPERSRMTPLASNSITLRVTGSSHGGQPFFRDFVLLRPDAGGVSRITVGDMRPGPARLEATAYPTDTAFGTAQGLMFLDVNIAGGRTTTVNADFVSAVAKVTLTLISSLVPGQTRQAAFAAFDVQGSVVLVAPQAIQWSSSNPEAARVSADGTVKAIGEGNAIIIARDSESGKAGAVRVRVSVAPAQTDAFVSTRVYPEVQYRLRQYTLEGEIVRDTPIPHTIEQDFYPPPVIVNRAGKVLMVSGRPNAYLNIYDPVTNKWDSRPLPGIAPNNEKESVNLASLRNYVFLIDYRSPFPPYGGAEGTGNIIRYDLSTGEIRRFGASRGDSVSMGWDGNLYVVQNVYGLEPDRRSIIIVYDPDTLAEKRRLTVPYLVGNVAVNSSGTMFGGSITENTAFEFAADGALLASAIIPSGGIVNLQLDRNGRLTMGGNLITISYENFEHLTTIPPDGVSLGSVSAVSAAPGQ